MLGDVSGLARPYRVEFRDRICGPVEMVVVPRGVEHRTAADDEAEIILLEPAGVLNTGNITDQEFTAHRWSIFWTAYPLDVKQLERGAPGEGGMELASADPGFHRFSLVSRRRVCRVRPQHISCRRLRRLVHQPPRL